MTNSTLPQEHWGVHRTHCCKEHGCKYNDAECPVVLGNIKQDRLCEICEDERLNGKILLVTHLRDNIWYVGKTTTGKHITLSNDVFVIRTTKEMKELYDWQENSSQP